MGIIQALDIYGALYFSYYYTVIYNEIVTQLTFCRIRSSGIKVLIRSVQPGSLAVHSRFTRL